ncbi:hypothetical protein BDB01DRAFT_145476 [Pilobolus umbonatus]|nr:hypothetical protein BDB01DRAFT_145476 [Pilobolus umbonatus]
MVPSLSNTVNQTEEEMDHGIQRPIGYQDGQTNQVIRTPSLIEDTMERDSSITWEKQSAASSPYNNLFDDIFDAQKEYQDYFAAEEQAAVTAGEYPTAGNLLSEYIPQLPELKYYTESSQLTTSKVRPSQTETNINYQEHVPYVFIKNQSFEGDNYNGIPYTTSLKSKPVYEPLEDVHSYKKSCSAYPSLTPHELNWQQLFHIQQKSKERISMTVKSVSWALYNLIKKSHAELNFICDPIFDESRNINDSNVGRNSIPLTGWEDIYDQLIYVFDSGELTAEHAIITYTYIKRMLTNSNQKLWDCSWRLICMAALLIAIKIWDDCAIFNADFSMIFSDLPLESM